MLYMLSRQDQDYNFQVRNRDMLRRLLLRYILLGDKVYKQSNPSMHYSFRLHRVYIEFVLFGYLLNQLDIMCIVFDPLKD